MSGPFIPFTEGVRGLEPEAPTFEPASIPDIGAPAPIVAPEKALADLADGLRLGLDGALLEQLLHNLVGGQTDRVESCPLPLRDFSLPARDRTPAASERAPSIVVTRVGDLVQKVTVECPCGERISLDCVY